MGRWMGFALLLTTQAFAEYRLYQYYISSSTKDTTSLITSALDPLSYTAFHGGRLLQLDILRTWICPGYTGKRPPCPSPYKRALEKGARER